MGHKKNVIQDHVPLNELSSFKPLHNKLEDMKSTQTLLEVDADQPDSDAVGRSKKHHAGDLHVTGEACYVDDMPKYQNELYLCLVTSTRAHAKILNVDTQEARKEAGFVAYIDHNDVTGSNITGVGNDDLVFADKMVTKFGQTIGAVVADTKENAKIASKLVKITYEDVQPCVVTIEDAIKHDSYHGKVKVKSGEAEEKYDQCEVQLEGQLRTGGQEHFYLETNCCVVVPKENDEIEIFSSCQSPTTLQQNTAGILGIPANKVVVNVKRLGGGFGGKETQFHFVSNPCSVAAYKLGRPIRCMLERQEDMIVTGTRHPYLAKYKVGATSSGKLVAVIIEYYSNGGNTKDLSEGVMFKTLFNSDNSYNIPHITLTGHLCRTNIASNTAFRGFGAPQAIIVIENILDRLAVKLDVDVNELKSLNMYRLNEVSYFNTKQNDCNLMRCWDECLLKSEYQKRKEEVELFNEKHIHRKRGISATTCKFGISFGLKFMNQSGALVHIYTDGSVLVTHGGVEMGQGLHTKMIQVASRALGISCDKININNVSTSTVPNTSPTAASTGSDINGAAVKNACEKLVERLKPYRSADFTWNEVVQKAYLDRVSLSATGFYKTGGIDWTWDKETGKVTGCPYAYSTYGSCVSEVEVDCLTGEHIILRTDIVMDLGKSLNPSIDVGQIEGGFIQGYGLYCLEESIHSPTGVPLTRGPGAYKIPGFGQCPQEFNIHLLDKSTNENAIYHSKGVGEPPLVLATSVFFAIKEAVRSHRKKSNLSPDFQFDSPATVERTRMAVGDVFTQQHAKHTPASTEVDVMSWSVRA